MRKFLSDEDRACLNVWRNGSIQVLGDVNPRQYAEPTGKVIVVSCGDGLQIHDICAHQARFTQAGCEPMVHTITLNGGPLLLAPNSPVLAPGDTDDQVIMKHIRGSHTIKGTPTVILISHAPCGIAMSFGLSVITVAELLLQAKRRLKDALPHLQVIPKLHVDWAQNEGVTCKKSYFVSRHHFQAWRSRVA